MLVNVRSAKKCCAECDGDFGHSANAKQKTNLKRKIRRQEKQSLRKELKNF